MQNIAENKSQDEYSEMKLTEQSGRGINLNAKQTFHLCKQLRIQKLNYTYFQMLLEIWQQDNNKAFLNKMEEVNNISIIQFYTLKYLKRFLSIVSVSLEVWSLRLLFFTGGFACGFGPSVIFNHVFKAIKPSFCFCFWKRILIVFRIWNIPGDFGDRYFHYLGCVLWKFHILPI